MIITCKKGAPQNEVEKIVKGFEEKGLEVNTILGTNYNVFGIVGDTTVVDEKMVRANPWIEDVTRIAAPYKKVNRLFMWRELKLVARKKLLSLADLAPWKERNRSVRLPKR